MKTLRTIIDRLEPWAMFLSILAILFVPSGKGWWWAILITVSFLRVIRAWREAGTYFSLETMGDVLSTFGFLVAAVMLYFLLHHVAPSYVHSVPELDALAGDDYVLDIRGSDVDGRLTIRPDGEDFYTVAVRRSASDATPAATGRLALNDLIIASTERYESPLPLRELRSWRGSRGTLQLRPPGTPEAIVIRNGGVVLHGDVRR